MSSRSRAEASALPFLGFHFTTSQDYEQEKNKHLIAGAIRPDRSGRYPRVAGRRKNRIDCRLRDFKQS